LGNPGAIRAGFAYQDLIAMREIVALLRHPDEIEAVELEADDFGSFDDVVVLYRSGGRRGLQVKFAVNLTDSWTWDDLTHIDSPAEGQAGKKLRKKQAAPGMPPAANDGKAAAPGRKRRATSLIQKWFRSAAEIDPADEGAFADVITNRGVADDVAASLDQNNKLVFEKIPVAVREMLLGFLGSEQKARAAASRLTFRDETEDIGALEKRVEHEFSRVVNPARFPAFKAAIRAWGDEQARRRSPKRVGIDEARRVAGFYAAVPVPEELQVPADFVVPDEDADTAFLSRLQGAHSALFVLEGDAGAGKSTYISDVYQRLRATGTASVRHHFWISSEDPSADRVSYSSVAFAILNQLQTNCATLLGEEKSVQSPDPERLEEWLDAVAAQALSTGSSLVLLIDGLDHLLREQDVTATNTLLNKLVAPRPGIKVVIASRPLNYPGALTNRSFERVLMPRLQRRAVAEILLKNQEVLSLPTLSDDDPSAELFDTFVDLVLARTGGLALHVRTAIRIFQGIGRRLAYADVDALPEELARSTEAYYRRIWPSLSSNEQLVLYLLARHALPWHERDLVAYLREMDVSPIDASRAVRNVSFLVERASDGTLTIHFSLLSFARNQEDYLVLQEQIDSAIVRYLGNDRSPESWRWGYLPILKIGLGNVADVVASLDHKWFVGAIAAGRAENDVQRIASATMRAALRSNDLAGYIKVGTLLAYYESARRLGGDEFAVLEAYADLEQALDPSSRPRTSSMSNEALRDLVVGLALRGRTHDATRFDDELAHRLAEALSRISISEAMFTRVLAPRVAASGALGTNAHKVATLIQRNATTEYAGRIAVLYLERSARAGHLSATEVVLSTAATSGAGYEATIATAEAALLGGMAISERICEALEPTVAVARFLLGVRRAIVPPSPRCVSVPGMGELGVGADARKSWRNAFLHMLADALSQATTFHDELRPLISLRSGMRGIESGFSQVWAMLRALADKECSTMSEAMGSCPAALRVASSQPSDYREQMSAWGFRAAFIDVLGDCAQAGLIAPLTAADVTLAERERIDRARLAEVCAIRPQAADDSAVDKLIASALHEVDALLEARETRAERYLEVLRLAHTRHRTEGVARASYAIGSALTSLESHKDGFLDVAIEAVTTMAERDSVRYAPMLCELGRPIAYVHEYTDGDQTRYLPGHLGRALLKFDPSRFSIYYRWLNDTGDRFAVEALRAHQLRTTAASDDALSLLRTMRDRDAVEAALARTPTDRLSEEAAHYLHAAARTAERDEHTAHPEEFPAPESQVADVSPEQLAAKGVGALYRMNLATWAGHWLQTSERGVAWTALREVLTTTPYMSPSEELYHVVRRFCGREESYQVLILTIGATGWSHWGRTNLAQVEEIVNLFHPDKARTFIADTLLAQYQADVGFNAHPQYLGAGFVRFLAATHQQEAAHAVTLTLVDLATVLTSSWRLPQPSWAG
jgi:hypothetical protein